MRTIAVEEHFASPGFLVGPGQELKAQASNFGPAAAKLFERLCDIGEKRVAEMDEAGIDVLLATSKHSIQYLLGGYRYFFFERMDAIGQSRYLPILIYPRGAPEKAAYFGNAMECFEHELERRPEHRHQARELRRRKTVSK